MKERRKMNNQGARRLLNKIHELDIKSKISEFKNKIRCQILRFVKMNKGRLPSKTEPQELFKLKGFPENLKKNIFTKELLSEKEQGRIVRIIMGELNGSVKGVLLGKGSIELKFEEEQKSKGGRIIKRNY